MIELLEGRADGDALFFSRTLTVEGDMEAVVALRNAIDGSEIYNRSLAPPGLFGDGGVDVYYSAKIPAGKHHLEIKMDDSVRVDGFDYRFGQDITIEPAKILLVVFNTDTGFVIK